MKICSRPSKLPEIQPAWSIDVKVFAVQTDVFLERTESDGELTIVDSWAFNDQLDVKYAIELVRHLAAASGTKITVNTSFYP